ncbi:hypothetical protein JX265_007546 [Neoarthrinium moseri]|uniref:LPXTG-motif cell wall anchor domain protein n=1 Tax=Neoarthrinium moseri TaxID=1658444 RepID=A0A9Q0AN22_9PEZI|nr:hypothetical protein JX266_000702 [Neoarthrinium moseri]KAI1866970.1 hypothetical protein JX265_007546 [Neoarthrinium moseri]
MAETPNNHVTTTQDTGLRFDFTPSSTNYHNHRQSHNPSKLPTFRFADLRKEKLALPPLLTPDQTQSLNLNLNLNLNQSQDQNHPVPPSFVSPGTDPSAEALDATQKQSTPTTAPHNNRVRVSPELSSAAIDAEPPNSAADASPEPSPDRSRALTFQTSSKTTTSATHPGNPKRSTSLDSTLALAIARNPAASESTTTIVPARSQQRRAPSYSESTSATKDERQSHDSLAATPVDDVTKEWAQGQRELLLPKSIQRTDSNEKRSSVARRPPISFRPPAAPSTSSGVTASIPPIRSFRSSGDRKSLGLDMNLRSPTNYDDRFGDPNHRDRTLRALEGRQDDEPSRFTPPDSAVDRLDDDSGDIFLRMAREEPEPPSAVSRIVRSNHRRPLSSVIPSYQPMSPPQVSRRLSDQATVKSRTAGDDQSSERLARPFTFRGATGDKATEDTKPRAFGLRASPLTPRSLTFQDGTPESSSAYSRRRQSITDGGSALPSRMSSMKQPAGSAYNQGRLYNSSPLVPKSTDPPKPDNHQGDHHTESSASTAAPSTVWDELEDLKSRMRRLELTGKLPPTSGAAISHATDERPPTATTNATTMSASPKRGSGSNAPQADAASTVSSVTQKEGQPLLRSAITKSRPFLAPDVYSALESAANDAMNLSTMIGTIGQPGPVSSAASNVGGSAVTDRQLRRKAESICRNLTELCLALSENAAQIKPQESRAPAPKEEPTSPTITRFSGIAAQRRPSAALVDRSPASAAVSPRAMTRLEERRNSMLLSSALPSPSTRLTYQMPPTPTEGTGRRTSLLIPRTRRAGTEDPEEQAGRKSSLLLRTRRAGTEEPEEAPGRRSSALLRTRRGTVDQEDEDSTFRFRAPSRAVTELTSPRVPVARDFRPEVALPSIETTSMGSSALPRRRQTTSTQNTRLVQPSAPSSLTARRYIERTTPDRESNTNNVAQKLAEDRGQRQFTLSNNSMLSRSGSLSKRTNRDSTLTNSSMMAQTGSYR